MSQSLAIISGIWALAVVIYYFVGKKHGYVEGYAAGIEQGQREASHEPIAD